MRYDIVDPTGIDRLFKLIEQRAGHWLAMQVEESKIALTEHDAQHRIDLQTGRRAAWTPCSTAHAVRPGHRRHCWSALRASVAELLKRGRREVPEQIDTVFFTGGSSGIPALRQSVAAMLPNAQHVEGNTFGSIGSGLAIEAQKRYG